MGEGPNLLVATHNAGKQEAFDRLLAGSSFRWIHASDLGLDEPVEDGGTFEANADIKSVHGATATGLPCLADDAGLEVDCLHGLPGVETAAYMTRSDGVRDGEYGREKLRRECLAAGEDRPTAHGRCVLSLAVPRPDGPPEVVRFAGAVHGTLRWPALGDHGFGFEVIFVPTGSDATLAEIHPRDRDVRHDHRASAIDDLLRAVRHGLVTVEPPNPSR